MTAIALALPDVGEDLALHVFELVEPAHRPAAVLDDQRADLPQRLGIEQAQRAAVGAVAHDQARAVMREAPAFAGVAERALLLERLAVVDEPEARLPGQLDDAVLPDGDPLAEIRRVERLDLQDLAGREIDLADPRTAVQAGALVEHAVDELEPLRECLAIVRIAAHDLEAVHRRRRGGAAPLSAPSAARRLRQARAWCN